MLWRLNLLLRLVVFVSAALGVLVGPALIGWRFGGSLPGLLLLPFGMLAVMALMRAVGEARRATRAITGAFAGLFWLGVLWPWS